MKKSRIVIPVSALWLSFVCFLITSCHSSGSKDAAYYQPPSRPAISNQQREELTEADIDLLVLKGDDAYEDGEYSLAQDYYYEALLAMPNPSTYVLVSYGASLANLQLYESAITMFNIALEKDSGNEVAKENIRICRQLIAVQTAEQTAEQRRFAQEQQKRRQESINNVVASLNNLSTAIGNFQPQPSQSATGEQGQSVASGSSSSSSGREKKSNFDISKARTKYNRYEKNAESAWNNVKKSGDYSAQQRRTFQECQAGMRKTREEAERNGYKDIRKSGWEDKPLP